MKTTGGAITISPILRALGPILMLVLFVLPGGCQREARSAKESAGEMTTPADNRTAIMLPSTGRAMILGEMRVMLGALSQFLTGAATGDTAVMRAAATTAGMKAAVDVNPAVSALLPKEFLQIGAGTHVAFDSLATLASQGASRDVLLGRLSGIVGRCVSCHSTYRLETTR
jgi:cytochrome c556